MMCGGGCVIQLFLLSLQNNTDFMSKVVALYHIVINTKGRLMTIRREHCEDMYRMITSVIKRNNCVLYRIGGIENHIHILLDLSPTVTLSHLVWDIKRSSSDWAKKSGLFPEFMGWGKEYGAFSISVTHRDSVIEYIKSQPIHHGRVSFEDEYRHLMERNGVEWIDQMLT